MSKYDALRSGFRELNRMLVDRQVFDAQQKQREANDIRQEGILASQLAQREFENEMAIKKFDASREDAWARRNQDSAEFILNKDKHNLDREYKEKKFSLDSRKANNEDELHAKKLAETDLDIKYQEQANEIQRRDVDRIRNNNISRPVEQVFTQFGIDMTDAKNDPEVMGSIKDIIGATKWNADTQQFETAAGEPYEVSVEQLRDKVGLIEEHTADVGFTIPKMRAELAQGSSELGKLRAQYKSIKPGDPRAFAAKNILQKQISELESNVGGLREQLSPEGQRAMLEDQKRRLETSLATYGRLGDETMIAAKQSQLDELNKTLTDPTKVPTQQRMAHVLDKEGNVVESVYINTDKGVDMGAMRPGDFDDSLHGQNVVWADGLSAMAGAKSAVKNSEIKIGDINRIDKAIDSQFSSHTIGNKYAFAGSLGISAQAVRNAANALLQKKEYQNTVKAAQLPGIATNEISEVYKRWMVAHNDALDSATTGVKGFGQRQTVNEEIYGLEMEEINKSIRENFGIEITPTIVEDFLKWEAGEFNK